MISHMSHLAGSCQLTMVNDAKKWIKVQPVMLQAIEGGFMLL